MGLPVRVYPPEVKPSLNALDDKLAQYLDFNNGYFVEAGANDGFKQSNTFYLENARGWKGALIEPIPELYQSANGYVAVHARSIVPWWKRCPKKSPCAMRI